MTKNKRSALLAVAVLAATISHAGAQSAEETAKRMQWFRHDKFGMFIHFGPYSQLAGEWKGNQIPVGTEAEWIMQRFNIPVKEYRERAHTLNPVNFDADAYVALAKAAGMKYLVITAKHHDGFAMFHTQVTKYNLYDWTQFKRDPVKELSEACHRAGIRFCVYYSHREDWDDPDGFGNSWDYDPAKKNFENYLEHKSKPQLRELLTNYGPIGLVWFDRGINTPAQAADFVKLVRTLQPDCLVNGRVSNYGQDLMGDYQNMNDNGMPPGGLEEDWETPQTLNTTWGYSKYDQDWKTPGAVIHRLVEIVGKGGNYLLNIGPMADGTIPAPSVATLQAVGRWMQTNSDSIYGTTASPLPEYPWGRTTIKGQTIYLHVFSRPADGVVRLSAVNTEVRRAYLLSDATHELTAKLHDKAISVVLPDTGLDANDTVVALELAGPLGYVAPPVTQDTDNGFILDSSNAATRGKAKKLFNRDGRFYIANWKEPEDSITWHVLVSRTGTYRLKLRYAASEAGSKYSVEAGEQAVSGTVARTGDWFQYGNFDAGEITFAKAGPQTIRIQPAGRYVRNLMYFHSLEVEPVAGVR
jgi:alpha-L-fucosidase